MKELEPQKRRLWNRTDIPELPEASIKARNDWKKEVKENLEILYAERRIGAIRDENRAKTNDYPEQ